jgi:hypothetical protein
MKSHLWRSALILSLAAVSVLGQFGPPRVVVQEDRLPNGKSQRDEIAKAEYEQNLKDAARLAKAAEEFKAGLEKDTRFVLSVDSLKKIDDIEKLAKQIRSRLRH